VQASAWQAFQHLRIDPQLNEHGSLLRDFSLTSTPAPAAQAA
jgi:hypothetical protein